MSFGRPHAAGVALLLLLTASACGASPGARSSGTTTPPPKPTPPSTVTPPPTATAPASTGPSTGGRVFPVTSYDGCLGDGVTDCYAGMQAAITAAQAAGGGTVAFPAGSYVDSSNKALKVLPGAPVTISGVSRDTTRLIARSSSVSALLYVRADHVTVQNLTFDSTGVQDGVAVLAVSGNYVTVQHCRILGGTGTSWPLRFAGGKGKAKPTSPTYATGNVVADVILVDSAPQRNDGLDFSFQENATISDVQHTGSRLGLYVDRNVKVTNYTFTPRSDGVSGAYGYYITPPSTDITITGFTTSGEGGVIGAIPITSHRPGNINVTVDGERMLKPGFKISVGDATNLVITNSHLDQIVYSPHVSLQGTMAGTTNAGVQRAAASGVSIDVKTAGGSSG